MSNNIDYEETLLEGCIQSEQERKNQIEKLKSLVNKHADQLFDKTIQRFIEYFERFE